MFGQEILVDAMVGWLGGMGLWGESVLFTFKSFNSSQKFNFKRPQTRIRFISSNHSECGSGPV